MSIKAAISPTAYRIRVFPSEEEPEPCYGTYEKLQPVFDHYRGTVVGIKQRLTYGLTGRYGLRSLEQSAKTAERLRRDGYECHLMVHFGPLSPGIHMDDVMDLLGEGDVLTHIYRPSIGTTIFEQTGRVQECVKRTRKRGVLFETGCAVDHLSFDSIQKGFADGFLPDIISTDLVNSTIYRRPTGWLMLKMALYLNAGMPLEQIIRAVTYTPAKAWGILKEAGTFEVGRPADIAVFRLIEKAEVLADRYGGKLPCKILLLPMATVKKGRIVFQQIFM